MQPLMRVDIDDVLEVEDMGDDCRFTRRVGMWRGEPVIVPAGEFSATFRAIAELVPWLRLVHIRREA